MKGQETEHTDAHFEIERKFLIAKPDRGMLEACPGASCSEIVQTYLKCGEGESRRVRKSTAGGNNVFTLTVKKHITNTRASGSDDALKLTPPTILSLEQSLEFINDDELVEVTPHAIRMRKMILNKEQRLKAQSRGG